MINMTSSGSVVQNGKSYEGAKRIIFVSNGIVCSLLLYVLAVAFFVVFTSGDARTTLEATVAPNIKKNLAVFVMLASVETAMLFLVHYVKCGQKKLFSNSTRSKVTDMSSKGNKSMSSKRSGPGVSS